MIRMAVVGAGSIGMEHIRALEKAEGCCLCAVCDTDENRAAQAAKPYGVPWLTDYREIPGRVQADAVILNLPHHLHADSTVFFLEHGLHVLVEKPMANTTAECDRMLAAAARSGRKLAVGHLQRFFPANRAVRELVTSEKLGRFCMFSERRTIDFFSADRPLWFLDRRTAGGGIVMNYGAHVLDKLFCLTPSEGAAVYASCGNAKNSRNIEGHAQMLLKFPSGLSAAVTFSGYGPSGYDTFYDFTRGTVRVQSGTILSYTTDGEWHSTEIRSDGKHMERQLEAFCRYIQSGTADIATGEYGRRIVETIERIYRSAESALEC